MNFTVEEKNQLLKAVVEVMKENRGHGPRNIYIKYYDDYLEIIVEGFLSKIENHLMETFGREVEISLRDWYVKKAPDAVTQFNSKLLNKYEFKFIELSIDIKKGKAVLKLSF